jgi:hypothetical protein
MRAPVVRQKSSKATPWGRLTEAVSVEVRGGQSGVSIVGQSSAVAVRALRSPAMTGLPSAAAAAQSSIRDVHQAEVSAGQPALS